MDATVDIVLASPVLMEGKTMMKSLLDIEDELDTIDALALAAFMAASTISGKEGNAVQASIMAVLNRVRAASCDVRQLREPDCASGRIVGIYTPMMTECAEAALSSTNILDYIGNKLFELSGCLN